MAAFKLNLADLQFVLKQIKIGEANSTAHSGPAALELTAIYVDARGNPVPAGTPGATLAISDPHVPAGIRTVDGRDNNIVAGREEWGAANTPMSRLFDPNYINDQDGDTMPLGGGQAVSNTNYGTTNGTPSAGNGGHSGNVADADPRIISNLIVDMSIRNPAAVLAALTFAGSEDPMGDLREILALNLTPAQAAQAVTDANTALNVANAALDVAVQNYQPGNPDLIDAIQVAAEAVDAAQAAVDTAAAVVANPQAAMIALAEQKGLTFNNGSLDIPNVAPDEGLSAPFNAWMTFFGQFFDHGLDLISKGGNGTIYVPLQADDPLIPGADGVLGTGDDLAPQFRFMALTRSTTVPGEGGEPTQRNVTTSFVDQNQTYTSHASHQVFLREYVMVGGRPVATGKLLEGADGGLATWADVKNQARELLGIELTDMDVHAVPLLRTDAYGEFIRNADGFPQLILGVGGDGIPNTADDVVISGTSGLGAVNTFTASVTVGANTFTGAIRTANAFLDDIAHEAVPGTVYDADGNPATPGTLVVAADLDTDVNTAPIGTDFRGRKTAYDNELLDRHFITGDGRGNENIGLTAVHHIFHSEHNRQIDDQKLTILLSRDLEFVNEWMSADITQPTLDAFLAGYDAVTDKGAYLAASPLFTGTSWDGERLFQGGRMATEMQYQHLVFEEFGRKVQPAIDVFVFNSVTDINPAIFAEFANVVYRFGHSMLTENMPRIGADGQFLDNDLTLIESFLNPVLFDADGAGNAIGHDEGAAAIVRGMTVERGNEIDEFVVGALRNNLLGLPLDLAALNIARGRDTGMPTLNQAREQLYAASGSTFLEPYESWTDFASNLKNPISVVNFIAAYGTHSSITGVTSLADKRAAAWELVFGVEADGVTPSDIADRLDFLNATGIYAPDGTGPNNDSRGGLNNIDLWIGGLAEKKMPFGGMLGSTFNAVFELQMENLQDADRFYYLTRTQGQNFLNSLEQNSFAKMMMANTSLAQPGADGIRGTADDVVDRHIGVDSFATYDYVFEVDATKQADYNPDDITRVDPTDNDPTLVALGLTKVMRDNPNTVDNPGTADVNEGLDSNYFRFFGGEHVVVGGTSGNDTIITDFGDDGIWGDMGNDRIESGAGVDLVNGGAGNDIITDSGDTGDFIKGDEGDDVIANSNGIDILMGGSGKDAIFVGVDSTEVFAGEGDDFVIGGADVDLLMGNEGDDWLEGGDGFDTTAGDNSELFFNSAVIGHDVMFAGGDEHDFDAESGDDIMVQGESVMRNEGMFGFDWAIFKGMALNGYADMRIPIFTTEQEDTLRNRFDKTEALSGWDNDDTLIGDDRVFGEIAPGDTVATTENIFFNDGLNQAGIDRIAGLDEIVSVGASGFFESGNILLGGGGDDSLRGNGGDDILDGDRWLNVRISIRQNADGTGPEIATVDSMRHVFAAGQLDSEGQAIPTAWHGKSLFELMIARTITPTQMQITREILETGVEATDVDTAFYNDSFLAADGTANYTIVENDDGSFTVSHVNVTVGVIDPLTERNLVSDGVDTLRNIERLQFTDRTISLIKPQLELNGFDPVTRNWGDNFNTAAFTNNTGTSHTFNGAWIENLDTGGATGGSVRVTGGTNGALTFSTNNADDASVTRAFNLAGATSATVTFSVADANVGGFFSGDNEQVLFEFAADGVNFVTLRTFNGDNGGNITVPLPTNVAFEDNAAIRFRANNTLDAGETFSIDNLTINATFQEPANPASVDVSSSFTENALAQAISSDPRVIDDGQTLASARVVLTNAQAGDVLTAPTDLPGNITRTIDTSVPGLIIVTMTGTETLANYQAAIQAIRFQNTSDNPSTVARTIQVTVNDGFLDSNVATSTVNVIAVNDAPNAANDSVITNVASPLLIPEWTLLANDTDPEGNPISITAVALPVGSNLSTVSRTNGVVTVTDTTPSNGTFNYTGNDGTGTANATDPATVAITRDVAGTVDGTNAANILIGNDAASTFDAAEGNDVVLAGGGDDTINWNATSITLPVLGTIETSQDGRDFVDGGAGTLDRAVVTGNALSEAFVVYARAAALADGITGLRTETEIVITRNGAVIQELDNIEEITINTGAGNDTVTTRGDFNPTSLNFSTITVNDGGGDDTVDISGMQSAHRLVFRSNGGSDTVIGPIRPQDSIEGQGVTRVETPSQENVANLDDEDLEDLLAMVRDGLVRDASGYGNNIENPNYGTAGQNFIRLTDASYTDGVAGVRGTALTPREISNIVSNQDNNGDGVEESVPNQFGGTALLTFFGQYFDHGLDFVAKGNPGNVQIGGPGFPISAPRSNIVEGTGVDPDGVPNSGDEIAAEYVNNASPFVDQNQAYGSHEAITDLLRQWVPGDGGEPQQTAYLLTGAADASGFRLLPTLTDIRENYRVMTNGQELTAADVSDYDGTGQPLLIDFIPAFITLPDETEPSLDLDAIGHYFVAGDGRVNENVMLTSIHTIWARNHNYWVDKIREETGGAWTEEEYFQAARMMNIAEYQQVVFTEFTEAMAGGLVAGDDEPDNEHNFQGYDPTVDASISIEFAQAAYRFGHSMLNENLSYVNAEGETVQLSLVEAFLRPDRVADLGIEGLLAGAVADQHQAIDVDMVNALRNQLVGRPLDLAALNIFRGRDMGIAPFNEVRAQLYERTGIESLRPYTGWDDFQARNDVSDAVMAQLQQAYPGGFGTMDMWIGGLAEKPTHGQLGSTFGYIFLEQMDRLQHGDRFYYLEIFDDSIFENARTFSQIIARNTGLTDLPTNAFQNDTTPPPVDEDEDEDEDGEQPNPDTPPVDEGEDDDDNAGGGEDDDDEDDDGDTTGGTDDDEDDDDQDEDDDGDGDTTGGGTDDDDGTDPVECGDDDEDTATPGTGGGTTGGGTTGGGTTGGGTTTPPAESTTNLVAGTANADVLSGTEGADTILGLAGEDSILSGNGDDVVRGGDGNDFVDAGGGRDVVFGGAGDDDILAGSGADMVYGDGGADRILAGAGNDLVTAGSGNDDVMAGDGDDLMVAETGDGDDSYWGDEVGGSAGVDTLDMSAITANITANLGTGLAGRGSVSSSQSGSDTLWGIENLVGGSGSDSITASDAVNVMDGGLGADTYRFLSAAAANGDTLASFQPGDRVDLSAIDADQGTAGNQAFTLAAGAAFTGVGQLLVTQETRADGDYTVVSANTGGDATPEFRLSIKGTPAATAADFAL